VITFESDLERFTVFLADPRAATFMAIEDGAWRDPHELAAYYRRLNMIVMARRNLN
jgi:hypothetical protein